MSPSLTASVRSDLIYDVGLFDAADTEYYLFRGYKVVAMDANPLMIEKSRLRFAREIESQRLVLLNIGIGREHGTNVFWISDVAEWSSFDRGLASRHGTKHESVPVSVMPFEKILEQYGTPHYLKIDVEGSDMICVEALKDRLMPPYLSVESECAADSAALPDNEATCMLELLRDVDYRQFKLVSQYRLDAVRSNPAAQYFRRLVNSAAYGRLRKAGLSKIAEPFTDVSRIKRLGFNFCQGSSGPWGEDVPGGWMTFDKARSVYLRERRACRAAMMLKEFWYDWHAKC